MTGGFSSLRSWLIAQRDELAAYNASVPAGSVFDRILAKVDEVEREAADDTLTLAEASAESGYSPDHLRKCVADGAIPNAGGKGRPRIRRGDLPKKATRSATGYDAGEDALRLERRRLGLA